VATSAVTFAATQELHRRLEAQTAALTAQAAAIESQAAVMESQAAAMREQAAVVNAQTVRIDAFEQQATAVATLKRQMAERQAAVLATGRPDVGRLAAAR